jgi:hypothetical protein
MDRFDVSVDEILVRGIDLPCLLFSGAFRASYIEVKGPYADIYRDKNVPRKNEKIKPLLNELVVGMKLPITIDSLRAFDAHVVYEEVPEGKHDPGVVFINNFNLVVSNITNDPERITGNAKMELNGGFLLEGAGPAHVQISYPLDNLSKRYSYTVDIAGMSLARLNPWLSPQAGLFIKTGDLRRARFEISATSDSAWGNAYMVYEGLNMKVLKKNPKHEDRQVNKFFSGLANSLMHKDNPSKKTGAERVGLITFERDKYKSMIGFLVKPMMQGMKRIIIPVDNNVEKIEHLSPRMKKKEEQISAKKAKKLKKLEERNSRK